MEEWFFSIFGAYTDTTEAYTNTTEIRIDLYPYFCSLVKKISVCPNLHSLSILLRII